MAAINSNALSKFVGILEVAPQSNPALLTRIGSVRGLITNFDNTANAVDIKADDTGTVFKGFLPEVRIEGSFLENIDRDLIKLLLGGTSADVAAAPVAGASQVIAIGWAYNKFVPIEHQNGNGGTITINSVTASTDGVLVSETDYFKGRNEDGIYGIFVKDSVTVTTLNQTVTINYDYTPNATETLTFPVSFTESPRLYVKITATDSGKDRIITLDDATFEGTYGMEFLDVVEAGDLAGTTFVFKANKGSNFELSNEIL